MDDLLFTDAVYARAAVASGALRGRALEQRLQAVPRAQRDAWLDGLLALPELPSDDPSLPAGTVPYLPCEVAVIVQALREAPVSASDMFVDLGSGLGRVVLLAHLLCGARAAGIELQPHLVAHAQRSAALLGLPDVHFICGDATQSLLDEGTVFFIYASFGLSSLRRVLSRMQPLSARRRITLCAVDFAIPKTEAPWLHARPSSRPELVFYDTQINNQFNI